MESRVVKAYIENNLKATLRSMARKFGDTGPIVSALRLNGCFRVTFLATSLAPITDVSEVSLCVVSYKEAPLTKKAKQY